MSAGPLNPESSQCKNLKPNEKRRILGELLKLSKNGVLNYRDMKIVSDMLNVDRRLVNEVWKQYQMSLERTKNVNFEAGCKHHNGQRK